jgi:hypothetical protein
MSKNDIRVALSPLSGRVYAGRVNKDGMTWREGHKWDVTGDVIRAVVHLLERGPHLVRVDNEPTYVLKLEKISSGGVEAQSQAGKAASAAPGLRKRSSGHTGPRRRTKGTT